MSNDKLVANLALGALAYFAVVEPLLESVNLKDTAQERADDISVEKGGGGGSKPAEQNPWSPQYVKNLIDQSSSGGYSTKLLTVSALNKFANDLYDAKGSLFSSKPFFNDDEELVYAVMRSIVSKSQLSQLAGHFISMYRQDLWEYLRSFLNNEELAKVTNIVLSMKTGKIKNGVLS